MDNLKQPQYPSCKKHTTNKVVFIKTTFYDQEDILKCGQCAIEDISNKDYIHIETIKNIEDESILKYWPPLCDEYLLDQIYYLFGNQIDPIQKIEDNFNNFRDEIVNLIELKKKIIIQSVLSSRVDIYQIYNKISNISRLKQILASNQDYEQISSNLKNIINEMHQLKYQNTLLLLESKVRLERYYKISDLFKLDDIKKIFETELNQLDNQLDKNKLTEDGFKDMKQQIDSLIVDNSHKDKSSLIQKFNETTSKLNQIFSIYDFKLLKLTYTSLLQQDIQTNSIHKLFGQASYCDYQQSNLIKVLENSIEKKITVIKHNYSLSGYIYFKQELNANSKYIIKFQFNDKGGEWITLGLIKSTDLFFRLSNSHYGKAFGKQFIEWAGDIVKGSYFFDVSEKDIIEMRVDIQNKQIYFIDVSQSNSINQLNKEYLLDNQSTYYLALDFGTNNRPYSTKIDIICFQEVDKF